MLNVDSGTSATMLTWLGWVARADRDHSYVPIKSDYSDLHDVAAYFIGAPDGTGAHDGDAEKIARQGKQWARDHWREVDLFALSLFTFVIDADHAAQGRPISSDCVRASPLELTLLTQPVKD